MTEIGALIAALAAAFPIAAGIWRFSRRRIDSRRVRKWLEANSQDDPGESHRSLREISEALRITEERVEMACLADDRIFRSSVKPEQYSIWRKEPQSIYEKRGLLFV